MKKLLFFSLIVVLVLALTAYLPVDDKRGEPGDTYPPPEATNVPYPPPAPEPTPTRKPAREKTPTLTPLPTLTSLPTLTPLPTATPACRLSLDITGTKMETWCWSGTSWVLRGVTLLPTVFPTPQK